MKAFGITAVNGGSGKTIISIGLSAWFNKKGFSISTFKKGPDYIDAGWLALASGCPCHNLDLFLMNPEDVLETFYSRASSASVALVEGNRGVFDGVDSDGTCSTAELFKLLNIPAFVVVDVTKMTRTAAAVVLGLLQMDPDLEIAGVILNKVGNSRHESVVRKSIEDICGLPVVGAVPRKKNLLPERHLGLLPAIEHRRAEKAVMQALELVDKYVDMGKILEIVKIQRPSVFFCKNNEISLEDEESASCKIGVVKDSAFQFYYPENIEALQREGAELSFFSSDSSDIPHDMDALYIGGGFPEIYLERLANNKELRKKIFNAVENGMPVYAECGGLMFLGRTITYHERTYPMVGVLPIDLVMCKKPQGHGYTVGQVIGRNPYYLQGEWLKGHEFHYSKVASSNETLNFAVKLKKGHGIIEQFDGIVYKNCVAFYTHVHALGCKQWAKRFVKVATEYRKRMKRGNIQKGMAPVILDRCSYMEKLERRR